MGTILDESLWGFVEGFVTQSERAKVHRNKCLCSQFYKGLNRFLGIHVDVPFRGRLVGPDRQKGDFNGKTFADFLEPVEISTVSAMEDRAPSILDMKTSEPAMGVMEDSCPPMSRGSERDLE